MATTATSPQRRLRPNARALHVAQLIESAAVSISATFEHIAFELVNVDGYRTSTFGAGEAIRSGRGATDALNAVEGSANRRMRLEADAAQLRDDLVALEQLATSVLRMCHRVQTTREPTSKPRCWGGGLAGYHLAAQDGGWSTPGCSNIPANGTSGPCVDCLARHETYRRRHSLPDLAEQPAGYDVSYYIDDSGVAHVRST